MARTYSLHLHQLIEQTEIRRNFGLRDQMYRAAGSIMDNIAEGFERGSNGEFKTFLAYAKGSCGESRSQLYRCLDHQFITPEQFATFKQEVEYIAGKIQRIIAYLNSSDFRGPRFT